MNDSIFEKVEQRSNVKKEDILKLAKSISNQDLNDEGNLRDLIHKVAKMAGKEVTKEKEDKIVNAVKKDKVPKDIHKVL